MMSTASKRTRLHSALLAVVMVLGLLAAGARPASAEHRDKKEKMYRIGTYALGGVTAYGLVKKKTTLSVLGAAGTYLAYRGWKNEVKKRHQREGRRR